MTAWSRGYPAPAAKKFLNEFLARLLAAYDAARQQGSGPAEFAARVAALAGTQQQRPGAAAGSREAAEQAREDETRLLVWAYRQLDTGDGKGLMSIARALEQFCYGQVVEAAPVHSSTSASIVPRWDVSRGELWVGRLLIKSLRQPAPEQRLVLAAFEEEGWPQKIDDPLSPRAGKSSARRLHHTLRSLNRAHKHQVIRFGGDGTGESFCWRWQATP